jgi:nitrate reductase NapE
MTMSDDKQRRQEEFRSWLFLTVIMAPVLAVLIVSGYGFVVWMLQAWDLM